MDPRALLEDCLKTMAEQGASDLYLKADTVPRVRATGVVVKIDRPPFSHALLETLTNALTNDLQKRTLAEMRSVDFAFQSPQFGRFRANVFYQKSVLTMVIRGIRSQIPKFAELHIPKVFEQVSLKERGLILIAGATSSGKSTTVASMVDFINENRDAHVISIEDPIEYMHDDKRCIINQREIGQDANSFYEALKYVVRQDPDVIVIGEMRDPESFRSAITASETGHLVISTIHAKNVFQVFDRILSFFPVEQREQVLGQLSFNLQAVSCQRLLPKKDGTGFVPAFEILLHNPIVGKLIREAKLDKLLQAIINSAEEGMQTFNQALCTLYQVGYISKEEAMAASDNPQALEMNLQGIFLDDTGGGILDR